MLACAVRTYVNRYAALAGRQKIVFTTTTTPGRPRRILPQPARRLPRSSTRARRPRRRPATASRACGAAWCARSAAGRSKRSRSALPTADAPRRLRRARDVRRLEADVAPDLASGRAAALGRAHRRFRPRRAAAGDGRRRGGERRAQHGRGARRRRARRPDGGGGARSPRRERGAAVDATGVDGARAAVARDGDGWQEPSSTSRTTSRPRTSSSPSARASARSNILKRYTTLGMATDQGKTANVNGLAMLAESHRALHPPKPASTTLSPAVHAGRDRRARRSASRHGISGRHGCTAGHDWARGAAARRSSRPGNGCARNGSPRPARRIGSRPSRARSATVRAAVGVCDVSTLGKIDMQGRDAGAFLDRIYVNTFSTLPVGKARYGLMLREDGFVMDDGTTRGSGPSTTSCRRRRPMPARSCSIWNSATRCCGRNSMCRSSRSPSSGRNMPSPGRNRASCCSVSSARRIDVSNEAFPYPGLRGVFAGGNCRRASSASPSPASSLMSSRYRRDYGDSLMRAMMERGAPLGVMPYGSEALGVMRIEKGHVVGQRAQRPDDGRRHRPRHDASKKKDFIGRVLAGRPALTDPERRALVGLKPVDRAASD